MATTQPDTQYDRQLVKVNDVILHVIKAGPEDGQLVLLLHGFPEFWYGWRNQIDALANAGYRVIVPDQRGYNQSDKPKDVGAYRIQNMVADADALIRWAGREQAIVIGHDWGAMVAWWLALLHPERVQKLGILNAPHPWVFYQTLKNDWGQRLKSWYAGMFQLPWLPEALLSIGDYQLAAQALKNTSLPNSFSADDVARYREAWAKPGAATAMFNWYRAYVQFPVPKPASQRLPMPVLMIWGMNDVALGSKMAQPSIDLCEHGRLVTIAEATHWVQHDAPEQVNRLLLDFIAGANPA
ncbi:MAG: alpha/beta hydrolase [Armatimonadetes bacterium]|nr:alpha/beta hydrolase [Anaerolineae bacterium]